MTSNIFREDSSPDSSPEQLARLGVSSKPADYPDETQSLPGSVFPSRGATKGYYAAYDNGESPFWGGRASERIFVGAGYSRAKSFPRFFTGDEWREVRRSIR